MFIRSAHENRRDSLCVKSGGYTEARPEMRAAIAALHRFIVTPTVAKASTCLCGTTPEYLPDQQIIVIARDDDYFFGVLHSRFHEKWALRMGTSLEDRSALHADHHL